ncbi:MAG: helix-turn-helix domain-containing protein [Phocaeicola sp.]
MFKVPEDLSNKQSYRIKKQRFHIVEYTNVSESTHNEVVVSESVIVYIVKGTKIVTSNNTTTTITKNQLFMAPKGHYIMSEYLPEEGTFESIMLFFNEEQIVDIITSISKSFRVEQKFENKINAVNCSSELNHFFESLKLICSTGDRNPFAKELISVKIKELIYLLLSDNETRSQTIQFLYNIIAKQHNEISKVVKENLYSGITLAALEQMCNMSVSTFKRQFEQEYKASPIQWIMDKKLEKAFMLIKTTSMQISEIAYECGFENYVHFSRRFKSKYGKSANSIRTSL